MSSWVHSASALSGIGPDILKLLSLLLLSSPLALPLPRLARAHPGALHLYSIAVSAWFLLGVFGLYGGTVQLLAASLATYAACYLFVVRPAQVDRRPAGSVPWWIFAGLLIHLTVNHSKRIFWNVSYDTVEITGVQMVLVIKLSTFAWNLFDGHGPAEELDQHQLSNRLTQLPNLLEFLGYCFFFPSLLVGPAITFKDYKEFADGKLSGEYPCSGGRFKKALKSLGIGLGFAVLVGIYGSYWNYDNMLNDDFLSKSWFQKFIHVQISGLMSRGKYYLVWSLSESSFIISSITSSDGKGGQNIDIWAIETAQNFKGVFDNWNMKTNVWLRECVYKRVTKSSKKSKPGFLATMLTFATSAAWHGPLPAYFLVFLSGGLIQSLARSIRRTIRPFFLQKNLKQFKPFYDLIGIIIVQINLNYLVIPFLLLDISKTLKAWIRVGWYGHVLVIIPMILLWFGGEQYLLQKLSFLKKLEEEEEISVDSKEKVGMVMKNLNEDQDIQKQVNNNGNVKGFVSTATATVLIGENGKIQFE